SGARAGVIWNQATGTMAATVLLTPVGALLSDRATVERQVTIWGDVLSSLADDAAVRSVAVTMDLVPESGTQLADHVAGRVDPAAPAVAREVLSQLVAQAPHGSSRVTTRLTMAVAPTMARPKITVPEAAAETLRALHG